MYCWPGSGTTAFSDDAVLRRTGDDCQWFSADAQALVPFPTRTLGMFLHSQALINRRRFLHAGYFVFISIAFRLLWWTVARNSGPCCPLLMPARSARRPGARTLVCFATALSSVAWFSPAAALVLSFAMWVYWIVWFDGLIADACPVCRYPFYSPASFTFTGDESVSELFCGGGCLPAGGSCYFSPFA